MSQNNFVEKKVGKPKSSRGRRKASQTTGPVFYGYIHKVLKRVHPSHGISKKGMVVMNSICMDMFERICGEASRIARYGKRNTLTSKNIQTAIRLIFPGELSNHAVSAGIQSVSRFNDSNTQ
jgi:histone H2B